VTVSKETMIDLLGIMIKIRRFEEKLEELVMAARISGFVHLYIGQEAVAAGVCANLRSSDIITSTHRGHGHLIAKGGDIKKMMAELFGKSSGYCKGKGGSMHIADLDLGILGANGIVGGGPPLAVGAGLAAWYRESDNVSVSFFGDGASNQGTVHEAMNLASVKNLPVIFAVENNGFGEFTRQADHQRIESITDRAAGYGMPSISVDGNDVMAVYEASGQAIQRARKGKGPSMLEFRTYRHRGHYVGDPEVYRTKEEVAQWQSEVKDPIQRFIKQLIHQEIIDHNQLEALEVAIRMEIEEAVSFAEQSPVPDVSDLLNDVYA
jgi:acetoin:2,6-dichlorophenolindophenol oxidoreductase subunit alpha